MTIGRHIDLLELKAICGYAKAVMLWGKCVDMDERGCFTGSMYADGMRKGCNSVVYMLKTRGARQHRADGDSGGGGDGKGDICNSRVFTKNKNFVFCVNWLFV